MSIIINNNTLGDWLIHGPGARDDDGSPLSQAPKFYANCNLTITETSINTFSVSGSIGITAPATTYFKSPNYIVKEVGIRSGTSYSDAVNWSWSASSSSRNFTHSFAKTITSSSDLYLIFNIRCSCGESSGYADHTVAYKLLTHISNSGGSLTIPNVATPSLYGTGSTVNSANPTSLPQGSLSYQYRLMDSNNATWGNWTNWGRPSSGGFGVPSGSLNTTCRYQFRAIYQANMNAGYYGSLTADTNEVAVKLNSGFNISPNPVSYDSVVTYNSSVSNPSSTSYAYSPYTQAEGTNKYRVANLGSEGYPTSKTVTQTISKTNFVGNTSSKSFTIYYSPRLMQSNGFTYYFKGSNNRDINTSSLIVPGSTINIGWSSFAITKNLGNFNYYKITFIDKNGNDSGITFNNSMSGSNDPSQNKNLSLVNLTIPQNFDYTKKYQIKLECWYHTGADIKYDIPQSLQGTNIFYSPLFSIAGKPDQPVLYHPANDSSSNDYYTYNKRPVIIFKCSNPSYLSQSYINKVVVRIGASNYEAQINYTQGIDPTLIIPAGGLGNVDDWSVINAQNEVDGQGNPTTAGKIYVAFRLPLLTSYSVTDPNWQFTVTAYNTYDLNNFKSGVIHYNTLGTAYSGKIISATDCENLHKACIDTMTAYDLSFADDINRVTTSTDNRTGQFRKSADKSVNVDILKKNYAKFKINGQGSGVDYEAFLRSIQSGNNVIVENQSNDFSLTDLELTSEYITPTLSSSGHADSLVDFNHQEQVEVPAATGYPEITAEGSYSGQVYSNLFIHGIGDIYSGDMSVKSTTNMIPYGQSPFYRYAQSIPSIPYGELILEYYDTNLTNRILSSIDGDNFVVHNVAGVEILAAPRFIDENGNITSTPTYDSVITFTPSSEVTDTELFSSSTQLEDKLLTVLYSYQSYQLVGFYLVIRLTPRDLSSPCWIGDHDSGYSTYHLTYAAFDSSDISTEEKIEIPENCRVTEIKNSSACEITVETPEGNTYTLAARGGKVTFLVSDTINSASEIVQRPRYLTVRQPFLFRANVEVTYQSVTITQIVQTQSTAILNVPQGYEVSGSSYAINPSSRVTTADSPWVEYDDQSGQITCSYSSGVLTFSSSVLSPVTLNCNFYILKTYQNNFNLSGSEELQLTLPSSSEVTGPSDSEIIPLYSMLTSVNNSSQTIAILLGSSSGYSDRISPNSQGSYSLDYESNGSLVLFSLSNIDPTPSTVVDIKTLSTISPSSSSSTIYPYPVNSPTYPSPYNSQSQQNNWKFTGVDFTYDISSIVSNFKVRRPLIVKDHGGSGASAKVNEVYVTNGEPIAPPENTIRNNYIKPRYYRYDPSSSLYLNPFIMLSSVLKWFLYDNSYNNQEFVGLYNIVKTYYSSNLLLNPELELGADKIVISSVNDSLNGSQNDNKLEVSGHNSGDIIKGTWGITETSNGMVSGTSPVPYNGNIFDMLVYILKYML